MGNDQKDEWTHAPSPPPTGGGRCPRSEDLLAFRSARQFSSKEVPLC